MKTNTENTDQLLKRGFRRVNLFVLIIMILTPFLTYQIFDLIAIDVGIKVIVTLVSIFVGIGLAWLWWSYSIVKWKCYAFSKVNGDDIYTLYYRAVSDGLIWATGSFFNKTEIWTTEDKEYWSTLSSEVQILFDNKF